MSKGLLQIVVFLLAVLVVVAIGFGFQVHSRNESTEILRSDVRSLQRDVDRVRAETQFLHEFVDTLTEETPSEQARNDAITRAVQQVPQIREILCEAFPGARACAQD